MSKILLLEDDSIMISLLSTLLEIEGYETVQPGNSLSLDDLLKMLRSEKPALVLLDVNLEELNGFDVLRAIRAADDLKPVRVIMSSGMDYAMRCDLEGADAFLLKPFMPDELIGTIKQTLGS